MLALQQQTNLHKRGFPALAKHGSDQQSLMSQMMVICTAVVLNADEQSVYCLALWADERQQTHAVCADAILWLSW